jgi:WD40 repeat protein
MRRLITRTSAAVTAGITLSALAVTGVTAAGAATQAPRQRPAAAHPLAVSGAQLWVKRYSGPGNAADNARSVAVSPVGGTVYVTGISHGATSVYDYATIAYNAASGARLWVKRYNGPANSDDEGLSVAVSPDGSKVYVTGTSIGATSAYDYATIAYSAATGARLWVKRYNGPGNGLDNAESVAVSPAGGTVYVTGSSEGTSVTYDYATVAYDAFTGAQLWVKRYNGPGNAADVARSVAVSPSGSKVYVTGTSIGTTSEQDYATIAYSAATGARLWVKRYNGPSNGGDVATSLAAPGNGKVYVTGSSGGGSLSDYATVAYDAFTGTRLWVRRYNGPGNGNDEAFSLAARSGRVFVTGGSAGAGTRRDYATIAYSAATGARLWVKRYNGPGPGSGNGSDEATSLAAPGNGKVYVTGSSGGGTRQDYATVAYDAFTGAQLWVRRYNGPGNGNDEAFSLAARSGRVFVTGRSEGTRVTYDYATVAYNG